MDAFMIYFILILVDEDCQMQPNPKNPIIASFFRTIGFADTLGSGTRKLFKYSRYYSGSDPELIEGDVFRINVPLNDDFSFDYSLDRATDTKTDTKVDTKTDTKTEMKARRRMIRKAIFQRTSGKENIGFESI